MRVQHNIMAMNAYRNYSSNTNALSKNLEKLSSGYKINRAGDDAAGLAISEKMRAQVTGLQTAQSNAKSGVNLVQTAEGSLTEVHDMLNRMVKLADQSANGTYDNSTDRSNLQKEVTQLKSEIDRIADSSNFNGIKLLDGSLGAAASESITAGTDAVAPTVTVTAPTSDAVTVTDGDSSDPAKMVIDLTGSALDNAASGLTLTMGNGVTVAGAAVAAGDKADPAKLAEAFDGTTFSYGGQTFTGTVSGTTITFTAGANAALTESAANSTATLTAAGVITTPATGAVTSLDFTGKTGASVIGSTLTTDGKTYEFVKTGDAVKTPGNTAISVNDGDTAGAIATALNGVLGTMAGATHAVSGNKVNITTAATGSTATAIAVTQTGRGLTLQIGDTSDDFNKLNVSISDMHATALGIGAINISTQDGASAAVDLIKAAINSVSSTRGDLGATQNRLEHTMNNLSVMTENTQDAESTIRDTDVADEMMAYTKNNILVQSAQAMLAQANQVPQGVLQLMK